MNVTQQESKIIPYPKNKGMNIGIVIFGIIFIYLVATIVMYLMAPHVTVYEVRQGSILKDSAYTGLAVREELVFYAEADGYNNYYVENNGKVRAGSEICTILHNKIQYDKTSSGESVTLTDEQSHQLLLKIQSFNDNFRENDFNFVYQLKQELQGSLDKYSNQSKAEQLKDILSSTSNIIVMNNYAKVNGVIVQGIDGLESVKVSDITSEHFNRELYKKKELANNVPVRVGDPLYKMVTDEKWQLLLEISEETKEALNGKKTVKVRFEKDNQIVRGTLSFLEEQPSIACVTFEHSMIRYINDRFLDVELILEDETGLKIPKSAETTKKFYLVPKTYLTQGGNSSSEGVLLQSKDKEGNDITQFLAVTVYFEEDGYVYLDPNIFGKNTTLLKPDSAETYELSGTRSLRGVFCINKGYAVFKQIKVLCESDEYYIVEEGNKFGLSNYDHIALDSSSVNENDVVF